MSYAACERNGLGSSKLMQPTRVQGVDSLIGFKYSDLRSKCPNGTVYIWKYMVPLLPRRILGMPLILLMNSIGIWG